jgi:hypothetical protein
MRPVHLLVLLIMMSDRSATATFTSDQSEQIIESFLFISLYLPCFREINFFDYKY